MTKLTKREIAELIREMPDASDDEILAEVRRLEAGEPAKNSPPFLLKAKEAIKAVPDVLRLLTQEPRATLQGGFEGAKEGAMNVAPTAARVIPAIGGAMVGTALGGPVGTAVGGGVGAAGGEALAQKLEGREKLNKKQIALQGVLGAVPVVGKAGSLTRTVLSRGGQGAVLGAAGAAGTQLAEGNTPTFGDVVTGGALGAAFGGVGGAAESRALRHAQEVRDALSHPPQASRIPETFNTSDEALDAATLRPQVSGFLDPVRFTDPVRSPLVDGTDYAIVTWANPGKPLSPEENAQRMAALAVELKRRGHEPILQKGVFDGEEESFLIPGMGAQEAKELGRMGDQVSVIHREGYTRLADNATFPNQGVTFERVGHDPFDNYYSVIELPGHGAVKYRLRVPEEAFDAPATPLASGTPEAHGSVLPPSADASSGTAGASTLTPPLQTQGTSALDSAVRPQASGPLAAHVLDAQPTPQHPLQDGAQTVTPSGQTPDTSKSTVALNPDVVKNIGSAGLLLGASALEDNDPDSDYHGIAQAMAVVGAAGLGRNLRAAARPKGVFRTDKGFRIVHPVTGREVKVGLGANTDNVRPPKTTQGIPPKWAKRLGRVGLKNGTAPPVLALEDVIQIDRHGNLRFTKEVEARLRTLFQYGDSLFANGGDAEWIENGILDDLLKFLPVEDPKVASHRLIGATSPANDVIGNTLDTMRIAIRAKLQGITGPVTREVAHRLMRGIGNRPAKNANVGRALSGESLQSYAPPDPFTEGKAEDLSKGMAGKLDAIPFDMWWARAIGLAHDAQPLNGISYKLLYDAGADVAARVGQDPFPFMAKVWAAMKHLHDGGGGLAPNKLARDIGIGQIDLFDASTTPSGAQGKKMLRQIMQGGSELVGSLGVSKRATKILGEDATARNLVKVAKDADYKNLRVLRPGRVENIVDRQTYREKVTNRKPTTSFDQGIKDATQATGKVLARRKAVMAKSVEGLGKHIQQRWTKGTPEQPLLPGLSPDKQLMLERVTELLFPEKVARKRFTKALREALKNK
jgi:hypothetical protein